MIKRIHIENGWSHAISVLAILFLALRITVPVAAESTSEVGRPNFVFVLADDWGWGDLGCYGHPRIRTPNLDRLASEGILYTQFHVASGVCSPSRTAVMTGRYPARHGVHGHFSDDRSNAERGMPNFLDPNVPLLTRLLRDEGYRVGHYGKWHLGSGKSAPEPFAYGIEECRINSGNGPRLSFGADTGEGFQSNGRHRSTEVIIDESIAFIERNRGSPFYINVWLNDTHALLVPDEEQIRPYRSLMPNDISDQHKGAMAVYYGVVTSADHHIGRLMDALEVMGLDENTVFVFSSDNGPEDIHIRNASHSGVGSAGPLRGRKRSLYNGGICVPFIVRWPAGQGEKGVVDDTSVLGAVDLLPTFCSLAGVSLPGGFEPDGENVSDILRGIRRERSHPLFWEWRFNVAGHVWHRSPMLAVRDGPWKLLMNPDRSRVELYQMPTNRDERQNVAAEHPKVVERLSEMLLAWQSELPEGPVHENAGSNSYPWP